ncbi:hypothetical protein GCM10007908_08010 [Rhizobium albus]|nr:hypothetical protein GCM10007908_08010 [Rhizobium albus]
MRERIALARLAEKKAGPRIGKKRLGVARQGRDKDHGSADTIRCHKRSADNGMARHWFEN